MLQNSEKIASMRSKGLWLFQTGHVTKQKNGTYQVKSQTEKNKTYTVTPKTKLKPASCTCEFYRHQQKACKHLYAAQFAYLFALSVKRRIAQISVSFLEKRGGQYDSPAPKDPQSHPAIEALIDQTRRLAEGGW